MADASGSSKKPKKKVVGKKKDQVVDEESAKSKNLKKKQTKKKGGSKASKNDLEEKRDDDEGPTIEEMMVPMLAAKDNIYEDVLLELLRRYQLNEDYFLENESPKPEGGREELTEWKNFWYQTGNQGYSSFNAFVVSEWAAENLSFYNLVLVLEGYASDLEDSVGSARYLAMYCAFYKIWQKCFEICISVEAADTINISHDLRVDIAVMHARVVEASDEVYEWAQREADGVRARSGGTNTREHTRERSGAKGSNNPPKARKKSK